MFIGRTDELNQLTSLFDAGARSVTVLGAPGIGKTTLSRRFLALHENSVFCDLSRCRTLIDLCHAVVTSLHLPVQLSLRDSEAIEQLVRVFQEDDCAWMVLDNAEGVANVLGQALQRWTETRTRFVVTSRERIHECEQPTFALAPLAVECAPGESRSAALELFLWHAQQARGNVPIPDHWNEDATELVRHLEGIPLAVVLIARRTNVLSPRQLIDRLNSLLDLGAPASAAELDLRTLRQSIALSWEQLTDPERNVFVRAAVFETGFDVDMAEDVLGGDRAHLLDVLQSLQDKSLLMCSSNASEKSLRLRYYESVRVFASERLALDRALETPTRDAHARYFEKAARGWILAIGARVRLESVVAIRDHYEDLEAAIDYQLGVCRDLGASASSANHEARCTAWNVAAAILAAVHYLHILERTHPRFLERLDTGIGLACPGVDLELLARMHSSRLAFRRDGFDFDGATRDAEAQLELSLRLRNPCREGIACTQLGRIAAHRNSSEALRLLSRATDLLQDSELPYYEISAYWHLGWHLQRCGDFERARGAYERARIRASQLGTRWFARLADAHLLTLEHESGRFEVASTIACELDLDEQSPQPARGTSRALIARVVASLWLSMDRIEDARPLLREAEKSAVISGAAVLVEPLSAHGGQLLLAQARRALAAGDLQRAAELRDQAATRWEELARRCREREGVRSNDFLLQALRILGNDLERYRRADSSTFVESERDTAQVAISGRWFDTASGKRVALGRRRSLIRILASLAAYRQTHPGRAVAANDLIDTGWPDERVQPQAALTRLHTAVYSLRRMGLADALRRQDDGYLLDISVRVTSGANA